MLSGDASMELQTPNGSKIPIAGTCPMELGRSLGLGAGTGLSPYCSDRTVSRRHLSLHNLGEISKLSFEVIGKNPIWVCRKVDGDKRVFRKYEKGELREGDCFTLSLKKPVLLHFRRTGGIGLDVVERREGWRDEESLEGENGGDQAVLLGELESELGSLDVSGIDPVKEFGFLVRGHGFDHYPKDKIRPFKDWKWFLDESEESSDDEEFVDEVSLQGKKGRRKKRKGGGNESDEEWSGQSVDEKVVGAKTGGAKRPKYFTRSKDPAKPPKYTVSSGKPGPSESGKSYKIDTEEVSDEDETLAGFIVDDDEEAVEQEVEEDEEEEDEEEQYDEED